MASWESMPLLVNRKLLFAGIFLTALSGLVLEVSITRIFSAAIWYHFAFVAVSVALVGLGASGLVVQYGVKKLKGKWPENLTIFAAMGDYNLYPHNALCHACSCITGNLSSIIYDPFFCAIFFHWNNNIIGIHGFWLCCRQTVCSGFGWCISRSAAW